jgi:hypothetical protein
LVDELLSDWFKISEHAPTLATMTPREQEEFVYRQAFVQHRLVTDEAEQTLRQIREKGEKL